MWLKNGRVGSSRPKLGEVAARETGVIAVEMCGRSDHELMLFSSCRTPSRCVRVASLD